MVAFRRIDFKGHVIEVRFPMPNEKLFFDGEQVSSKRCTFETDHLYEVREKGQIVTYHVRTEKKSSSHSYGRASNPILAVLELASTAIDLSMIDLSRGVKVGVICNGEVVYNEGILFGPKFFNDLKKEQILRQKGVKFSYCLQCGQAIIIPNSKFCPNCGKEAQPFLSGVEPKEERVKTARSARKQLCAVCKERFERGDLVTWCPFCGNPAHRIHLIRWLHDKGSCPSCGKKLGEKEFKEVLL